MTESNVFNQSFDDLLAQAGIAGSSTNGEPPVNEKPKTEPAVMSFDDILQQEGLEDVTNNPSTANEVTEEPNITEEYRVTTDVFGENDKPNDLPTFEDLMAQAGGIETKETATEQVNETSQPEVTGIPSFDDLMAQAGALNEKPQAKEEVIPEAKEEVITEAKEEVIPEDKEEVITEAKEEVIPEDKEEVITESKDGVPSFDDLMAQAATPDTTTQAAEEVEPEVKEEVKGEVESKPKEEVESKPKEEIKPEPKEEVKPKVKRARAKTKTTTEPSEDLIDKDTVDEINTAIHGIVRNAVRKAFKDAMDELAKSFE